MACGNSRLAALALGMAVLAQPAAVDGGGGSCSTARAGVRGGTVLTAADVVAVGCDSAAKPARLRFDRASGAVIALEAIPAGGYLGRVALPRTTIVQRGQDMSLRSRAGPVVIERSVTAMQTARSGHRVFVRDAEGHVFAVRVALADGSARR